MANKILLLVMIASVFFVPKKILARERFFEVQSIDTMKFSRDVAREKIDKPAYDVEIDLQVKNIAETGATHVALSTPYDDEFLPFLKRWVTAARKYNLKVWFRGNLSGWENWFDYPRIDRETHTKNIQKFIFENPSLFEDGDIFTSCPECENGGPGDPRMKGDVDGYRNFLKEEYRLTKQAFATIGKNVAANYYSMNGDVARLVMNKETTKALDGAVTIDHYVNTPEKLEKDIKEYILNSEGKIVLGEFGAPIPDIHGIMSDSQQENWIDEAMKKLVKIPEVVAINYWTNMGSSTELWSKDNSPRLAVNTLSNYFNPINLQGVVADELKRPLDGVEVKGEARSTSTQVGKYILPVMNDESVLFSKDGYVSVNIKVEGKQGEDVIRNVTLIKKHPSFIYTLLLRIIHFFKSKLP